MKTTIKTEGFPLRAHAYLLLCRHYCPMQRRVAPRVATVHVRPVLHQQLRHRGDAGVTQV
eukprot:9100399-Pyramimonas_sp.AAC.1